MPKKDPKKTKDVVEPIAEHSPQPAPATANGANGSNDDGTKDPRSSSEKPAKVSYQGDASQTVVNGVS